MKPPKTIWLLYNKETNDKFVTYYKNKKHALQSKENAILRARNDPSKEKFKFEGFKPLKYTLATPRKTK
jgi:hypothetical protein